MHATIEQLKRIRDSIERIEVVEGKYERALNLLCIQQRHVVALAVAPDAPRALRSIIETPGPGQELQAWRILSERLHERHPDRGVSPLPYSVGLDPGSNGTRYCAPEDEPQRWIEHAIAVVDLLIDMLAGDGECNPPTGGRRMSADAARRKAEAIVKRDGWPVYRGKPSERRMAERVGCAASTLKKALAASPVLRKALNQSKGDELARLVAESEDDARRGN